MQVARSTYEFQMTIGRHDFIGARWLSLPTSEKLSDTERILPTIFLFSAGAGSVTIDQASFPIHPSTVVIAPMLTVRNLLPHPGANTRGAVIAIADDLLMFLVSKGIARRDLFRAPTAIQLPECDMSVAESAAAMMIKETAENHAYSTLARLGHFQVLLASVLRNAVISSEILKSAEARSNHGQEAYLLFRFKSLIEEHYRQRWPLSRYAANLSVSEARLRAAASKLFGARPMQMVQQRLMTEAQRLLAYSVMSISEIAAYLGFSEQAHFTRFFKTLHGAGPSAYRRAMAKRVHDGGHQPSDLRQRVTADSRSKLSEKSVPRIRRSKP